jgi:hypothetical protein
MPTPIGYKSNRAVITAVGGAVLFSLIAGFFLWEGSLRIFLAGQSWLLGGILGLGGAVFWGRAFWFLFLPKVLVLAEEEGIAVIDMSRSRRFVPFSDLVDLIEDLSPRRTDPDAFGRLHFYGKRGHLSVDCLEDVRGVKAEILDRQIQWLRRRESAVSPIADPKPMKGE